MFETVTCAIPLKVQYLNSKKVIIMWLLQRVHSETKVSCDFVIYNKSQCVHGALDWGSSVNGSFV